MRRGIAFAAAWACLAAAPMMMSAQPPARPTDLPTEEEAFATQVAAAWFRAVAGGEVAVSTTLSDVPFAWDRKEVVDTLAALRAKYTAVAADKGKRDIRPTSVRVVERKSEIAGNVHPQRYLVVLLGIGEDEEGIAVCVRPGDQYKVVGFTD